MRTTIRLAAAGVLCLMTTACFNVTQTSSLTFGTAPVTSSALFAYPPGSTAGIKTVAQLGPSVSAVTNVPLSGPLMSNYQIISSWLSADGNATSLNSSMLMSITQFMAVACQSMIAADAALSDGNRWADNGVNYTSGPNGLVSGTGSSISLVRTRTAGKPDPGASAIEQYTSRFWRRPASDDEFADFSAALINAVKDSTNFSSSTSAQDKTIGVLLVPCTMALASPAFLLN